MKIFKDIVKYFLFLCLIYIVLSLTISILQFAPWSVKVAAILFIATVVIVVLNYILPDEKSDGDDK